MDLRTLARPVAKLVTTARCNATLVPKRGHKTTARTKRSLKIAPHDSFLPSRSPTLSTPPTDSIIYNPPSSEASPAHTPFIFLPRSDPRRLALLRMKNHPAATAISSENSDLPPTMRYKHRSPRYNLQEEQIEEIKKLRAEDPIKWSVGKLAAKFDCSEVFVKMVAPASQEHHEWLKEKMERKTARWGPKKTQARDDRRRRAEMVYRGEL